MTGQEWNIESKKSRVKDWESKVDRDSSRVTGPGQYESDMSRVTGYQSQIKSLMLTVTGRD